MLPLCAQIPAFTLPSLPPSRGLRSPPVQMASKYCLDSMAWVEVAPKISGIGDVSSSTFVGTVGSGNFLRCDEDSCETIELAPISEADVTSCQTSWANAIQTISKTYLDKGDYIQAAADAAADLYGYGRTNVLFKPTKAADEPFRPTGESAMSYFVGGNVVDEGYEEDAGFAINGGKGWKECIYDNHQVEIKNGVGIAMGNYYFTSAADDSKTKVEYTFGYTRCDDGKVRIFLHHSSVPYSA